MVIALIGGNLRVLKDTSPSNLFSRKLNSFSFLFSSLINMYLVEVPNVDPSKAWQTVAEFKTRSQAIAFSYDNLCCTNGWYPMLTTNGSYWSCDTPNPQLKSRNNQFLTIEEFELECDCLDFIRANFPDANADGNIYLISQTN